MLTSKWSSDSSSSEPDDGEITSPDESPTEAPYDPLERAITIRDDPSEDTDSPFRLLSAGASELGLDTYERSTGHAESDADADAEDSDDWESKLEQPKWTSTELINTISCQNVALPNEAAVKDFQLPSDDNKDATAPDYRFLNTQAEVDRVMNAIDESKWPLDLATGNRIDPALKLVKQAKQAMNHQEPAEKFGEERRKPRGSDDENGKGIEEGTEGEGERKL